MNSFANTLFTLLFGWLRSLVQGIWNAVIQGDMSQFFVWLGDHWIPVLGVLCIGCTVLDYLIWFIRWRPYLVWRTKFRRMLRRRRGQEEMEQQLFDQGYEEAVALEMAEEEEYIPDPQEAQPEYIYPEEFQQPGRYFAHQEQETPAYDAYPEQQEFHPRSRERRRRRSERNERKKTPWERLERLAAVREEEEGMLDGLPPAVDRQQAFHEPVYPERSQQAYAAWQRPKNPTDGTKA